MEAKRIVGAELYVDDEEDMRLLNRTIRGILRQLNKEEERLVVAIIDELKCPEDEIKQ